jgi:Hemerythrin HHE cation binding domain
LIVGRRRSSGISLLGSIDAAHASGRKRYANRGGRAFRVVGTNRRALPALFAEWVGTLYAVSSRDRSQSLFSLLARVMQRQAQLGSTMDIQSALEDLTSVDHRATALLRREHEVILSAFRQFRDAARGPRDPRQAIEQQIAALIEMHDRVERTVVYPALAPYYGPLVRALTAEHDEIAARVGTLRNQTDTAEAAANIDRLEHLTRDHIGLEETSLLTPFERDQPGLNARLYESIVAEKERLAGAVEDIESRS